MTTRPSLPRRYRAQLEALLHNGRTSVYRAGDGSKSSFCQVRPAVSRGRRGLGEYVREVPKGDWKGICSVG